MSFYNSQLSYTHQIINMIQDDSHLYWYTLICYTLATINMQFLGTEIIFINYNSFKQTTG